MVRYTVTFTGRVQGVGFRYTTDSIARRFNLTGWVRNDPDGSVKTVIEGERAELDRFVAAIQNAMDGYIQNTQTESSPASGEFRGFAIRP